MRKRGALWSYSAPSNRFAALIRRVRTDCGMPIQELADSLGTAYQAIHGLERRARKNPTLRTLERVAKALGFELYIELRKAE